MKKVLSLVLLGVLLVGCANTSTEKPKETMNGEQPQQQVEQPKEEKKAPFSAEDLKRDEKWNVDSEGKKFADIPIWDGKVLSERPRVLLGNDFNFTGEYTSDKLVDTKLQIKDKILYLIKDNQVVFQSGYKFEDVDGKGNKFIIDNPTVTTLNVEKTHTLAGLSVKGERSISITLVINGENVYFKQKVQ